MINTEGHRDTSTLGGALGEAEIIGLYLGPERLAEVIGIEQQQRTRGSAKVSLADEEANMFRRRAVLEAIDRGLHELNGEFPGERLKAGSEQDPTFREQRDPLLSLRGELAHKQGEERGTISRGLSEKSRLKGKTAPSF